MSFAKRSSSSCDLNMIIKAKTVETVITREAKLLGCKWVLDIYNCCLQFLNIVAVFYS